MNIRVHLTTGLPLKVSPNTENPMVEAADFMMKYKVTPAMAHALLLLLNNKIVTPKMVEVDDPITTDSKVLVHRIRRRLAGTGIEVRSQRNLGYWLDQASKEIILRDLEDKQMSLPLGHGGSSEGSTLAA